MGNYGSAHNLQLESVNSEMTSNYQRIMESNNRYQKRNYQEETSQSDWTKSLPSALTKKTSREEMAQYKVLPTEIKHSLKLRATTNGQILQSGGTISGRKSDKFQRTQEPTCAFRRAHTMMELERPGMAIRKVPAKIIKCNKKRKAPDPPSSFAAAITSVGKFTKNATVTTVPSDHLSDQRNTDNEASTKPIQSYRSNMKGGTCQKVEPASGAPTAAVLAKGPYRREKSFDELLLRTSHEFSVLKPQELKRNSAVDSSAKPKPLDPHPKYSHEKSTFYFGMNTVGRTQTNNAWHDGSCGRRDVDKDETDSACAYIVMESIVETNQHRNGDNGILVRIRPTLPRRQVEIPSFSPFAAWRLLQQEEKSLLKRNDLSGTDIAIETCGSNIDCETQVQLFSRTGANWEDAKRNTVTKSWTPQQDLADDDDSVSDGDHFLESVKTAPVEQKSSRSRQRGHVFSLSLPRDRAMYSSPMKDTENFNSLQKTKGHVAPTKLGHGNGAVYDANNWLLHNSSKSRLPSDEKLENRTSFEQVLRRYFNTGKHVIYLPDEEECPKSLNSSNFRAMPCGETRHQEQPSKMSQRRNGRESLQDNFPLSNYVSELQLNDNRQTEVERKPYTTNRLSSTIRKLENKRYAQKLVRHAEIREAQRISELEAMKRVEEDFQKNRALEKAEIREQMKVYINHMKFHQNEITQSQEGPLALRHQCDTNNNETLQRAEPEGADCSIMSMSSFNENYNSQLKSKIPTSKYSKPVSQNDLAIRMYP